MVWTEWGGRGYLGGKEAYLLVSPGLRAGPAVEEGQGLRTPLCHPPTSCLAGQEQTRGLGAAGGSRAGKGGWDNVGTPVRCPTWVEVHTASRGGQERLPDLCRVTE